MAEGLPTPKSREQILSEMLTEYVGLTGINDLNTGSAMTQFFDVVARSIARTSGDVFQILRDYSLDRATGEALNRIGSEERVDRNTAQVASGKVKVTDTSFEKISTKIYSGASAPNIGSTTLKVSDASLFTATGRVYIGRGTPNIEGPLNYSAIAQVGSFWEITLDSPTKKFHNISESVILGQGGTRNVSVGTVVTSQGIGATPDINYNVSSATILLDGENVNETVQVVAQEPGSSGNAPAGAVREFTTIPFPGSSVINIIPFTTGADSESDEGYRDRIKKERLSRGLGTALAVKNAVLGAQASDENARVTSNEIDTTNPEQTTLYIDNGEGYEEKSEGVGLEFIVDSAIGGEQNFQLATGGNQTSVAKAFLQSSLSAPFDLNTFDKLSVLVGGIISEHTFLEGAFKAENATTAYEVVASINDNPDLTYEATTAENGVKVVIRAKAEDGEFLQMTSPSSGVDAGPKLGFPSNEVQTVLLYKNRELLNKNGRSAFIITKEQFDWSNSITDNDTLIVTIDGTSPITFIFKNEDFIEEGQHSIVAAQNNLSSWANVINSKVTGVTAEVNAEQLKLTSNLGTSNRASLVVDPSSTLVIKGMFSTDLGLSAQGNEADFEISRNTAQIKLNKPLSEGESLNLGSPFTRAEIQSTQILGGQTTLSATGYVWLVVDDPKAQAVSIGVTGDTFLNVSKPGGGIVRYNSTSPSAFDNVQVGDYVIIWSEDLSAANRLEGRVSAVTSTDLDIKVTTAEESAAIIEGPIFYTEGFTVIRTELTPQKLKVDAGVYDINAIAVIMSEQLSNAVVSIDNDEIFVIRSNSEDSHGALFLADFNDAAKSLNFIKNTESQSINSQIAFYETGITDKQFPAFVHGKINTDQFADPPNFYINTVDSSEDLDALGLDPSGWACFAQPYGGLEDVVSTECVEIEKYTGVVINVEDSVFYRRSRVGDRYYVLNGYDFGHNDSVVAILDDDPNGKTFNMPLYRTAVANITLPSNPNNFRAYDVEGGIVEFTEFFGNDFLFDNYKVLMQAKNGLDPLSNTDEDAILYRSVEWGRSGEKFRIGYFYPTTPDQGISHIVSVGETVDVKIFIKSGPVRVTTIDGTTEWNVATSPFNATTEYVTYTYSGTGTAPSLGTLNSGDYVSIINSGEFSNDNLGSYKIDSSTASSFTVKRAIGEAVTESNIATLETNTISFFEPLATTAQEIVDYVGANISDHITAKVLADNGTTGAGEITLSTEEDSAFTYSFVSLLDGKNHILSTDLDALAGSPQFTFKTSLSLPTFSTNTIDAYSFNNGENIKIVPITSVHVSEFFNILAVTGYTTLGEIKSVDRNTNVQFSTDILGTNGAVQVAGGTGTITLAAVEGSASVVGDQVNLSSIITILTSVSDGLHSDQWVKVSASEIQKKITFVNSLNSVRVTQNTPNAGFSKIELFNRDIHQRFFGRNRYHTRTRGRTFKVENQGEFACMSWDENGTEPFFLKNNINVKDSSASTITIFKDEVIGTVDITVNSGDMSFDEIAIGDLITIINRNNDINNGDFIVLGRSEDSKTLKILNPNAINELIGGSFTITDNVAVLLSTFSVDGTNLVEGTDFIAGIDTDATASNLAAAISLLPNINSTSTSSVANIESEVPGVTVAISVSGGGATASGATLVAPISNTGDLTGTSEVQEGDSVSIGSDFNILNQGIFRIIRRFKNSIYFDNPNTVEEEVTLVDQLLALGSNGSTDYNVVKNNGLTKINWAGLGNESLLELARPGDVVTIGTDFVAANQGEFHIVDSGEKLQEITDFRMSRGIDTTSGQYALIYSANDITPYYLWYNVDGNGGDPTPGGKTPIQIPVLITDTAIQVAIKTADVINNSFSADFSAVVEDDHVIVSTVGYGPTTNASNVDIDGQFFVEITQEGRRNFIDYINVDGVNESGITIADVFEIHREAIKIKEYEGTVAGDKFVISNNFLGEDNIGSFVVQEVLSETETILVGNMVSTDIELLDNNFNKIYVEEASTYVGYKKISLIATNPANLNTKNIVFDSENQFAKIGEIGGVTITGVGKLEIPSEIIRGVDSYKFHTGLIAESNRIVYGEPRDNTTYPGVAAAGAEIFIKAPLVRRIEVSINVRIKTGVPFSTIVEEVRSSITALINSNGVGQPIPISDIVSNAGAIVGVLSVAISSPQYDPQNDVIRVNSGEKALVLDIISDVLVSKID